MKIRLDLIESRLRQLIEQWMVPVARKDFQDRLAHQLVQALQEHVLSSVAYDPDEAHHYTIYLHPDMIKIFERQENLLANLALALQEAAREAEVYMALPPAIQLAPDAHLGLAEFRVETGLPREPSGGTAALRLKVKVDPQDYLARKAYLLLNGTELYHIDQAVINIGRRADNHIVIPDPRVSRNHAQIRFSRGAFTIFDLNSTGGTQVNGLPIHQACLKPGDVISLCGVALIYGEEGTRSSTPDDTGNTQIMQNTSP